MRVSDHRYARDRYRLDLALRLIRHEARTQTIRAWTGLSDDRIRKLHRSYLHDSGNAVSRPRGKSPQQSAFFTRTPRLKQESSVLASVCCQLGVLPRAGAMVSKQSLISITRGEALCQAFEVYREVVPDPHISFEHLVYLLFALVGGEELTLTACEDCSAVIVVDRMSLRAHRCLYCERQTQ